MNWNIYILFFIQRFCINNLYRIYNHFLFYFTQFKNGTTLPVTATGYGVDNGFIKGTSIWLRATGSTLVSQLIDSFIVLFIAFYVGKRIQTGQGDPWSLHQVLVTGTGNYIYKFVVAIMLTPVIYGVHAWIEKYLGKPLAAGMKQSAMGDK